mmetsp:Transcript_39537/g.38024  ORF Transcript_39537/g.38024 Transcript_39537/m.38024 type:complete len:110 (+) Transcript_39537:831-1160(+)
MAPNEQLVEISKRPEYLSPLKGHFTDCKNQTQSKAFDFMDWKTSPAFKNQGDVFRMLPAHEYIHTEKVRKIVKTRKQFNNANMFKYGEYLESLNEEIKFNVDTFSNFKT